MPSFQVFVTDDRYAVPTLHIIQAANPADACAQARRMFDESPHHRGVEVFDEGARLLALGVAGGSDDAGAVVAPRP